MSLKYLGRTRHFTAWPWKKHTPGNQEWSYIEYWECRSMSNINQHSLSKTSEHPPGEYSTLKYSEIFENETLERGGTAHWKCAYDRDYSRKFFPEVEESMDHFRKYGHVGQRWEWHLSCAMCCTHKLSQLNKYYLKRGSEYKKRWTKYIIFYEKKWERFAIYHGSSAVKWDLIERSTKKADQYLLWFEVGHDNLSHILKHYLERNQLKSCLEVANEIDEYELNERDGKDGEESDTPLSPQMQKIQIHYWQLQQETQANLFAVTGRAHSNSGNHSLTFPMDPPPFRFWQRSHGDYDEVGRAIGELDFSEEIKCAARCLIDDKISKIAS